MKKIILIPLIILSAKINAQQIEYWTDYFYYNDNVNTANEICILENLNYGKIEKININNETIECNYNNREEQNKIIKEVKKIEKKLNNIEILIIKNQDIKDKISEHFIINILDPIFKNSNIDFIKYKIVDEIDLDLKKININDNVAAINEVKKIYKNNILNVDVIIVVGIGGNKGASEKIIIGKIQEQPLYMSTFDISSDNNVKLNAHEFGHILGLSHDKDTIKYLPKNGLLDNTYYSQGFKFKEFTFIDYSLMSYSKNTICSQIQDTDFCHDSDLDVFAINLTYTNDLLCQSVLNKNKSYNPCGGFYKGNINQDGYYDELNIYLENNKEVYDLSDNKRVLIQTAPLVASIGTRDYNDPLFIDKLDIQFKDEKLEFYGSKFLLGTNLNDNILLTEKNDIIVTSGTGIIDDYFDNIDLLDGDDIIVIDNFEKKGKTIIQNFGFNDKIVLNSNNFNISENSNEILITGEGTKFIDNEKQIIENGFIVKIMKNFKLNDSKEFNYDNYQKEKQAQVKEDIENCLKYLTKEECAISEIKKIDFNSDIVDDNRLQKISKNKQAFKYENRINSKVKRGIRGDEFRNYIIANDTGQNLSGEGGQDFMFGGFGNDSLSNSDNNNPLKIGTHFKGGKGNDRLYGTSYGDIYTYDKGDGIDSIYEKFILKSQNMIDTLIINGYSYEQLQITKLNKDIIIKMSETDTITIINGLQKDLQNKSYEIENIIISGRTMTWEAFIEPALILIGTSGNDFITPNVKYYDFKIIGGLGNDTLSADEGSNQLGKMYSLDGGEGDDNISVLYSNSLTSYNITGGTGRNTISGGQNKDIIYIQGIDTILNTKGNDEHYLSDKLYSNLTNLEDLIFRNGNDIILKNGNNIILTFSDYMNKSAMNLNINPKLIYGTPNVDFNQIKSSEYRSLLNSYSIMNNNYLDRNKMIEHALNFKGTSSNETYYGHPDFDNKYRGNKGNDTLNGTQNKDIYYFKLGDGKDIIYETKSTNIIIDEAIFENYGDYTITAQSRTNNLIISNGIDNVVFRDYLYKENEIYPNAIEKIIINQKEYNIENILNRVKIFNGSEKNDLYKSVSNLDNILYGNAGEDNLTGGDQIEFTDTIYGGTGRDKLVGCGGENYLYGQDDSDELFVFEFYCMYNLESKTTMDGGKGNDVYNGSMYSETYIVNENEGFDTINESQIDSELNKNDTLLINYINPILSRTQNNKDLTITNITKTSGVTIKNYFQKDSNGKYTYVVENIVGLPYFDIMDIIKALTNYNGTQYNDVHVGFEGYDNIMYGFLGNDLLTGNNEFNYKDTIYGGEGDDVIDGQGGLNYLYGQDGNDKLKVSSTEVESFTTMEGGKDNDIYEGSKFTEIYIINDGDGHDTISKGILPINKNDYKYDTLIINYKNPTIKRNWITEDIIIESGDKRSSVNLVNYLKRDNEGNFLYAIENIEGINQSNILDIINNITTFIGTDLPDTYKSYDGYDNILYGNSGKDTLIGSDELNYIDTIYGGYLDDTLVGCSGNNFMYGEQGNDILKIFSDNCLYKKNQGLTIMEGGIGDDIYFGSINKEIINYESGIDNLYFKELGQEDELNCRSGYYVMKYQTMVILYYGEYDQIRINNIDDSNFSIKNICGKTLNDIINEAIN